jgi:hypothetical protein
MAVDYPVNPVAMDQAPLGGTNFPFVDTSTGLEFLIADLNLTYSDDASVFALPFRLDWLHGFGSMPHSAPSFAPTPTHAQDVLIRDANEQVVFSSATGSFNVTVWNSSLTVLTWKTAMGVLSLVWVTQWPSGPTAPNYFTNIAFTNVKLDLRTCQRLPPHVTGIKIGSTVYTGQIQLAAGYTECDGPAD